MDRINPSLGLDVGSIPAGGARKNGIIRQRIMPFFQLSVPVGTLSAPAVHEVILRIVKCLRT